MCVSLSDQLTKKKYMVKMQREKTLLFDKCTVSLKKFILFFLWFIRGPECCTGSASRVLTVQTGGLLIIPCYYDSKYIEHKKYWCFDARSAYNYCSILAYANETKGKVSVLDHPDQSFFTVTMRNLQHEDTGAYYCVVEIGGIFEPDEKEQLHLTVQSAPDVSVVSSSVSGHEGGNISVQCFYSSGYQNKLKQWCRYKDQSCYTVRRTDTSQNSSVQISDDGRRSFTVLKTGLRLTDSGWYFCSAGDQQAFVQLTVTVSDVLLKDPHVPLLTVTEPKTRFHYTSTAVAISEEFDRNGHYVYLEAWIPAVVLLMVMVIVVSAVILRKKHNRNDTNVNRNEASDAEKWASLFSVVTYSSLTVCPKTIAYSPVLVEDEVNFGLLKFVKMERKRQERFGDCPERTSSGPDALTEELHDGKHQTHGHSDDEGDHKGN